MVSLLRSTLVVACGLAFVNVAVLAGDLHGDLRNAVSKKTIDLARVRALLAEGADPTAPDGTLKTPSDGNAFLIVDLSTSTLYSEPEMPYYPGVVNKWLALTDGAGNTVEPWGTFENGAGEFIGWIPPAGTYTAQMKTLSLRLMFIVKEDAIHRATFSGKAGLPPPCDN